MKEKRSLKSYIEALLTSKNLNINDCDESLQYIENKLNCTILKIITLSKKLHNNSAVNEVTPDLIHISSNNVLSKSALKDYEDSSTYSKHKEPLNIKLEWLTLTGKIQNPNIRTDIYTNKDVLVKNYIKHDLSGEHMKLLNILKGKILNKEEGVKSLLKNERVIEQLIPYLISFLSSKILNNLKKFPQFDLECFDSILNNPHISTDFFLQQTFPVLLSCLLNKQIVKSACNLKSKEHQKVSNFIITSSDVLIRVIEKHSTVYPELETKILYKIKQIIAEGKCVYNSIGCIWMLKKLIYNIFEIDNSLFKNFEEILNSKDKSVVKEAKEYLKFVKTNFVLNKKDKDNITILLNK